MDARGFIESLDALTDDEFQRVLDAYRARAQSLRLIKLKPYDIKETIPVNFANADPTLTRFYAPDDSEQGDG